MKRLINNRSWFKVPGLVLALFLPLMMACKQGGHDLRISLANTSVLPLSNKAIRIRRDQLGPVPDGSRYPVLLTVNLSRIPVQADDLDGDGRWDELFFVADLPAGAKKELYLKWSPTPVSYKPGSAARFGKRLSAGSPVKEMNSDTLMADEVPGNVGYEPFQTDGPVWENDKVGFRQYFDGRNSIDLFGKRVSTMALRKIGLSKEGMLVNNYQQPQPWGLDILAVGNSVGLGGMALQLAGGSYARLGITGPEKRNNVEKTTLSVIASGPVRSMIHFQYIGWAAAPGRNYQVKQSVVIWPGMYGFENSIQLSGLAGGEQALVGLVNSNTQQEVTEVTANDHWMILMTHDKQTVDKDQWLGMALMLPKAFYRGYGKAPNTGVFSTSYYAKLEPAEGRKLTYYAIAGWELSDPKFRDGDYFKDYVINLANQIDADVKVEIKK